MSGCEFYVSFAGDPACGGQPIAVVTAACLHEHISEQRACAACAAGLQQRGAAAHYCTPCYSSARSHNCVVQLIIRWDSGEVTRTRDGEWVTEVMAPDGVGWGGGT